MAKRIKTRKSLKTKIIQWGIRLRVCFNILSCKYEHWFLSNLTQDELIKLFTEEEFEAHIECCGMQPYVFKEIIRAVNNAITDEEIMLDKIEFEFNAKHNKD